MSTRANALGLAVAVASCGCLSAATYDVARTTRPGDATVILAQEHTFTKNVLGYGDPKLRVTENERQMTSPSVIARFGVGKETELGFRTQLFSSYGLEAKWNPVRTPRFDLAFAPSVLWTPWTQRAHLYPAQGALMQVPVLLGINVSDLFSVTLSPGIGYYAGVKHGTMAQQGALFRVGIGFDMRITNELSFRPEVLLLRSFRPEDDYTQFVSIGIGVAAGRNPSYRELR